RFVQLVEPRAQEAFRHLRLGVAADGEEPADDLLQVEFGVECADHGRIGFWGDDPARGARAAGCSGYGGHAR
nr:hypothetical protein [Gemmatimonadaceae bacterium]